MLGFEESRCRWVVGEIVSQCTGILKVVLESMLNGKKKHKWLSQIGMALYSTTYKTLKIFSFSSIVQAILNRQLKDCQENNSLKFSTDNRSHRFWQTISKELYVLSTHHLLGGTLKIMRIKTHMSGNEICWLTKKRFQSECYKSNKRKRENIVKI